MPRKGFLDKVGFLSKAHPAPESKILPWWVVNTIDEPCMKFFVQTAQTGTWVYDYIVDWY